MWVIEIAIIQRVLILVIIGVNAAASTVLIWLWNVEVLLKIVFVGCRPFSAIFKILLLSNTSSKFFPLLMKFLKFIHLAHILQILIHVRFIYIRIADCVISVRLLFTLRMNTTPDKLNSL